ncbi:MAG: DMT family transporter [Gemmatimonadaceae bacterium]
MVVLTLVAVAIGMMVAAQAGVNAQLRSVIGQPIVAALFSFAIGTIALSVITLLSRAQLPTSETMSRVPWWGWTGGLLGAVYITAAVVLAPRLGAAVLIASVVTGQLAAALLLDHFGLLGFPQKTVTVTRGIGALLLFVGVYFIQRR